MSGQALSRLAALVLVLATVMCLALVTCIALLFTIGKPTTMTSTGSVKENSTAAFTLAQPCDCGCPTISPLATSRIIQGKTAIQGSWPWQMLLIYYERDNSSFPICSGSLITSSHILTTADCLRSYSAGYVGVIPATGYVDASSYARSKAYMAEKIYKHESHDHRTAANDVAIIQLRTPIPLDERVGLSCLAPSNPNDQPLKEGDSVIASGWGTLKSSMEGESRGAQQVRLEYVSPRHPLCAPLVGTGDDRRLGQMCARFPAQALCYGDAGGSLVRSLTQANGKAYYQQVGIVSDIDQCGELANVPDLFTRVDYYHEWIMQKVRLAF